VKLERKAQEISTRLSRLNQDVQVPAKTQERFSGSQAPSAFRQSQVTVRQLQDQIVEVERTLVQKRLRRDVVLRQLRYFRQLPNFSAHRPRSVRLPKSNLNRADIRTAVSELLARNSLPQMADRLRAAVAVLDCKYQDAEEPLRELLDKIGEDISLRESLERRKQLSDRSMRVVELQESLEELKTRYEDLVLRQKEQITEYQVESEQSKLRDRELADLKGEKERRERESAKVGELKVIADSLRGEVDLLARQVGKLQADSNERHRRVESQVQTALLTMRGEVLSLEEKSERARKAIVMSADRISELEAQFAEKQSLRADAEKQFEVLQADYKVVIEAHTSVVDAAGGDPFEDTRFRTFLGQMIDLQWGPPEVQAHCEKIDGFSKQLDALKLEIAGLEAEESELNAHICEKRAEIEDLKVKLRGIADTLQQTGESTLDRAEYTEGAPNIIFGREDTGGDRITTIGLFFGEFGIGEAFIGEKPSELFLMLQFMDKEVVVSTMVAARSGKFNWGTSFKCENDHIFAAYIEKSAVFVKLCRSRGERKTEVGRAELVLAPFVEGIQEFTSTAKIWAGTGKFVGTLPFESALLVPLAHTHEDK
jgi:uncharacterized coiled-coil protein SlyX